MLNFSSNKSLIILSTIDKSNFIFVIGIMMSYMKFAFELMLSMYSFIFASMSMSFSFFSAMSDFVAINDVRTFEHSVQIFKKVSNTAVSTISSSTSLTNKPNFEFMLKYLITILKMFTIGSWSWAPPSLER